MRLLTAWERNRVDELHPKARAKGIDSIIAKFSAENQPVRTELVEKVLGPCVLACVLVPLALDAIAKGDLAEGDTING